MSKTEASKEKKKQTVRRPAVIFLLVIVFVLFFYENFTSHRYTPSSRIVCRANINNLAKAISIYANNDDDGKYPTVDKWCDLLVESGQVSEEQFKCPGNRNKGVRCTYAINPNCELNSPTKMVLLFETNGGWNQYGGPELLTTENHKDKGCNVLLNFGNVEFVKPTEFEKLNWGNDQEQ